MTRLGIPASFVSAPLVYGLQHMQADIELVRQPSAQNCRDLLNERLDAAFISPADYAGVSPQLKIVNELIVASSGASRMAIVCFRESLPALSEIINCVEPSAYQYLSAILLSEVYEMQPEWKKFDGDCVAETLLQNHPAVFLEDHQALEFSWRHDQYFDLMEVWQDKFEAPFVHQILVIRETQDSLGILDQLRSALDYGLRNLLKVGETLAAETEFSGSQYFEYLQNHFHYVPNVSDWQGLAGFFEYLYYYGFIEHIPGLNFYKQ